MDPTITTVIGIASTMVSALFGALLISLRQQREDWKALYEKEHAINEVANEELRKQSATNAKLVELSFLQRQEAENIRLDPQRRRSTDGFPQR